jgi:hypothetical protein
MDVKYSLESIKNISYIQVDPKKKETVRGRIGISGHRLVPGERLGLNLLKKLNFTIYFFRQALQWKPGHCRK